MHTLPSLSKEQLNLKQRHIAIGVEGVYDVNEFNHADSVCQELLQLQCADRVKTTYDLSDPECEYVIRGNFAFYRVQTSNGFHRFSYYLLCLPLLSGIPNAHCDGMCMSSFEVYRRGSLVKTYEYRDVFWEERSYLTVWPLPNADPELRLAVRLLLRDMKTDFFGGA